MFYFGGGAELGARAWGQSPFELPRVNVSAGLVIYLLYLILNTSYVDLLVVNSSYEMSLAIGQVIDLSKFAGLMTAKTAAERQREYRARRDADPEKREKYLRHERQRWRRDVEAGKKKGIKELSERGQRTRRKMWRQAKRRQKNREQLALGPTPPVPETENHVPMSHQATRLDKYL